MRPPRIVIEPQPRGCYSAKQEGEVIVVRSREPEFDACRVLLARGITGPAEIWRPGAAHPAMRLDIKQAVQLTVVDDATSGRRLRKWRPHYRSLDAAGAVSGVEETVEADFEGGAPT